MYKELIYCILIIVLIFSLDFVTQGYTESSINKTKDEIDELKNEMSKSTDIDDNKVQEKFNSISEQWNEYHNKLAYYIEHNELEKVETNLAASKSLIKLHEYKLAIVELDKTIFILDHINDKYSFNLENIF